MYRQLEKKLVKWQYLLHMPLQYGELQPSNGSDLLASLGHPSKFQRVSHLGFVTAVTSLTAGQPTLHDVWLTPSTGVPCSNDAKTRKPLKYDGVPQTNETISAARGPKFTILCGYVEEI